jgi:hypothetical protein
MFTLGTYRLVEWLKRGKSPQFSRSPPGRFSHPALESRARDRNATMSIRTRIEASITSLLRRAGYDLRRLEMGQDAYCDIKQIIGEKSSPVLFDVGANVGQNH